MSPAAAPNGAARRTGRAQSKPGAGRSGRAAGSHWMFRNLLANQMLVTHRHRAWWTRAGRSVRQSGRAGTAGPASACHSGIVRRGALAAVGWLFGVVSAVGQAPPAPATFELSLRQGEVVLAEDLQGDPIQGWSADVSGRRRQFAAGEVLAVHGCAVAPVDLAVAWLAGGEELRGMIVGGDDQGEHCEVLSPSLGRVQLAVDRLAALARADDERLARFPLPAGVHEAVLRRAAVGFDVLAGSLHQFGERGVRFQPDGDKEPRWFRLQDIAGVRIADAVPRSKPATAWLRTRTGDVLGVTGPQFQAGLLRCELENGANVALRCADLASLSFSSPGAIWLADLEPQQVQESGVDGDVVYGWRRDRAATGGALVASGRTHGKGLGVHARSRLVFAVPAGVAAFWTRVAVDDSAAALPVRADCDVRVLVGDQVRWERKGLGVGRPPLDTGIVPVKVGDHVVLEADFGRGRDLGDRVDWLSPVFLKEKP